MSKPKKYTITPVVDADGISTSQTPGAAGNLTITGALASGGSVTFTTAHRVEIVCAGADAARTFTVYGTDDTGASITESIAGSAASTTIGAKYFKTVTRVAVDAATAGAVTVGVNAKAASQWFPINYRGDQLNPNFTTNVSGTINYTVQFTNSNLRDVAYSSLIASNHSVAAATASNSGTFNACSAVRCITGSSTPPGYVDFLVIDPAY